MHTKPAHIQQSRNNNRAMISLAYNPAHKMYVCTREFVCAHQGSQISM